MIVVRNLNWKEIKLKNYIDSFIDSLKADGKSKCTIESYRLDLNKFAEFFTDKNIKDIRYADLRDWVNNMEENGLSASSRARHISSVKSFFRYLMKMEVIDNNPSNVLDAPKIEKKQPIVISNEDASELLFQARNNAGNDAVWFRDYTILATFLFTGVRREELTNIKLEDVDLKKNKVLIHGKGSKQRYVYVNDILNSILAEYIGFHRGKIGMAKNSEYLFPSTKRDKMCLATVNNIANAMMEKIGIKKQGVSVHILRKRFATSAFEATHDIATVSKLLGHSSPTVTTRYVVMGEDDMKNAAMAVSF